MSRPRIRIIYIPSSPQDRAFIIIYFYAYDTFMLTILETLQLRLLWRSTTQVQNSSDYKFLRERKKKTDRYVRIQNQTKKVEKNWKSYFVNKILPIVSSYPLLHFCQCFFVLPDFYCFFIFTFFTNVKIRFYIRFNFLVTYLYMVTFRAQYG